MENKRINHLSLKLKRAIFFIVVIVFTSLLGLLIFPLILIGIAIATLLTFWVVAKRRHPPKGTIEILPPESPPVQSTSDIELEVTIEKMQHKIKRQKVKPEDKH